MSGKKIVIREACREDAEFLSIGVREAERCHTGIGIFDLLLRKTVETISKEDRSVRDSVSDYIKHLVLNRPDSHLYFDKFLVAVEEGTGTRAGCACIFSYPEAGLIQSIPAFKEALIKVHSFSEKDADTALTKWDFVGEAFPDIECDNTWMVEAVFVSPDYRGIGLGRLLVEGCIDSHRNRFEPHLHRRVLIACAIGNDGAKRLYEKLGLKVVGQGHSEGSLREIHCYGFYMLST